MPDQKEKGLVHFNRGLATRWDTRSATALVPLKGIAGFHHVTEPSGVRLANMKLDQDISKYRVYSQGDGPSNRGHSRFGTNCASD